MKRLSSTVIGGSAAGIWIATTLFRLARVIYYGKVATDISKDGQVVRVHAHLRKPLRLFPGCYFYLYFPKYPLKSHPMVTTWWGDVKVPGNSSELLFLMQRTGSIARLASGDESLRSIWIDGPYGQDLRLHEFENVMLAAKGIGIVGILPYALDLTSRQAYDYKLLSQRRKSYEQVLNYKLFKDKTRKVDLFWVMDDNSQQGWLSDQLQTLQELDPKNVGTNSPC